MKRKSSRHVIERLEPRRLLSIFLNGIDSENMGKGMWAWDLFNAMNNTGFWPTGGSPNYSGFFSFEKNTQGMQYIIVKAADGNNLYKNSGGTGVANSVQNYTTTIFNAAHAAGIKILPYFYIYGGSTAHKAGATTSVSGEIAIFNSVMNTIGGDGAVLDIENEYGTAVPLDGVGDKHEAIRDYLNGIGKSQAGNGSGSRDTLFIAYSTFPYVSFHNQVPFLELGDWCDAAMPQSYWSSWNTVPNGTRSRFDGANGTTGDESTMTPTIMVDDTNSEYAQISFETPPRNNAFSTDTGWFYNNPDSMKPLVITGMTYDAANTTTASQMKSARIPNSCHPP